MTIDVMFLHQNLHYVLSVSALQPYFKHTYNIHNVCISPNIVLEPGNCTIKEKNVSKIHYKCERVGWVHAI